MDVIEVFRNKFRTYRRVLDEAGEEKARAALFDGYPERQKANMEPRSRTTHWPRDLAGESNTTVR